MRVLGVDPPNAWAVVEKDRLLAHGRIPAYPRKVRQMITRWAAAVEGLDVDVVAVEAVYLRERGGDKPGVRIGKQRSSLVLAKRAGIIAAVAALAHPPALRSDGHP